MIDLDEMAQGYIDAALWADCQPLERCEECELPIAWDTPSDTWRHVGDDEHDHPAIRWDQESGGLTDLTVSAEDRARVHTLCEQFVDENRADCEAFCEQLGDWDGPADSLGNGHYSASRRLGQDLRLTGGGHGVGFRDRASEGLDNDVALRLSAACDFRTKFDTSSGGDVWQDSETTAAFDHLPTDDRSVV